jgi:hypothetical protein
MSTFKMFAGRTNASGGPHAGHVLETPVLASKNVMKFLVGDVNFR